MSFSNAVSATGAGRWVHVAGQLAVEPAPGAEVTGDVESQTNAIFDRLEAILAECGGAMPHVVRITAYLTSFEDYASFSRARASRFGDALPASTAIQVAGLLFGATVEVDAVAFIPGV